MNETKDTPKTTPATHTPGPWAWFGNTDNNEIHLATERGGRIFVMRFDRWGMRSAQPLFKGDMRMLKASDLVRYERDYRKDVAEIVHPDARLIAAAPELLEACKAAERYDAAISRRAETGDVKRLDVVGALAEGVDLDALYFDWIEKASAAIAKAEGR